jgi:ketosteroid isomerase-like protein
MTTGPTPALMREINAAFNSRDVERIMSFFAEDCTFLMARGPDPEGRRVHGKAAVRKVLADRFCVITDMRWDHVDAFITGNRAVTVWMVTGTGADGEKLNYRGCDLYEFRGDKILTRIPTGNWWSTGTASSMFDFKDHSVLVTGAGGGIGLGIASFLATQPYVPPRQSAGIPCGRLDCRKFLILPAPVSSP